MTTRDVVFLLIGLITAASAILSVTTRQVVHAALWLVVCLGTLAGCYVVLGAELVALVQVLIYVGAVVVLVLFALMLTRAPIGRQPDLATPLVQRIAAAVLGVATTGLFLAVLVPLVGQDAVTSVSGDTHAVATAIFGTWVWPFELLSLLLLAALIGAFAVARVAGGDLTATRTRRSWSLAVMHLWLPMTLAAVLAGAGAYGILARRNAVLVLIGVELVLSCANLILVTLGSADTSPLQTGQVLALFVITIAAAEICVALAIVLAMFRLQGHIDLTEPANTEDTPARSAGGGETGMSLLVRLLVLLPAIAAVVGLLVRRSPRAAALLATSAASAGLVLAVVQVLGGSSGAGRRVVTTIETIGALPVGDLSLPLHLLTDRSSALVALAVTVVGLAVQVFSVWYLRDDVRYPVFAVEVSLFLAAMLLVVQSGDLVLTLVGWEVMGWCSYLLIGHVTARESARRAAHKAFLVTRVADIGFVLGVVLLAVGARTTDIDGVLQHYAGFGLEGPRGNAPLVTGSVILTVALVGIVVGVAGKSGLVPFHDWLPDAMEGPTPASALIHAATMVAAGTVVIARLHPLYAAAPTARAVLGVLAAVTMLWAALLAIAQSDVKRMLAYSTLSQIAIMLSALAFAPGIDEAPSAGLGHLLSHALFKSLLFLAMGWLSVIGGGTAFVALRGRARGRGALQWSIGIGLASLAGVPPLVGFFSKEGVLAVAQESLGREGETGWVTWSVLVALLVTVLLTAAYCTRAWLLLTTDAPPLEVVEALEGQAESAEPAAAAGDDEPTGAHEARPVTLSAALAVSVLALLTVVGAFALLALPQSPPLGFLLPVVSIVLIAVAAYLVRARATGGVDPVDVLGAGTRLRADRGFGVDTAYVGVGRAVVALARLVARLDRDVVDAYPRAAARLTLHLGATGDRVHRGAPSTGLVAVVVGVVVLGVAGVTVWR